MNTPPPHPDPVSRDDVERAASALTTGLDTDNLTDVSLVAAAGRHDGGLDVVLVADDDPAAPAALNALTAGPHRVLALAVTIGWAPTPDEATSLSWLALVVGRGQPVWAAVRRQQDQAWQLLRPDQLPWLAASSAAALRHALTTSAPVQLKMATDPRLFNPPGDGEPPPTDEHGHL